MDNYNIAIGEKSNCTETSEYERVSYTNNGDTEIIKIGFKIDKSETKPAQTWSDNKPIEVEKMEKRGILMSEYQEAIKDDTHKGNLSISKVNNQIMNKSLLDMWSSNNYPSYEQQNKPITKLAILRHLIRKHIGLGFSFSQQAMVYTNNSAVINYTRYIGSMRIDIAAIYIAESIQLTNLSLKDYGHVSERTFLHLNNYYQRQVDKINLVLSSYKFSINNNDINVTIDLFESFLYKHDNSMQLGLPMDYYSHAYLCKKEDLLKKSLDIKVEKYINRMTDE